MIFYYIVFYEYSLDFQKVKFVIFILIELFFDKK